MFAFLLIIGVSYFLVATFMVGLVGDSLYQDHQKQDMAVINRLSRQMTVLYVDADSSLVQDFLESSADDLDARLLVTDAAGKIQFDSRREDNGRRMNMPEVHHVLLDGSTAAYGIHSEGGQSLKFDLTLFLRSYTDRYYSVSAAPMMDGTAKTGTIVMISSVQEMVNRILDLQKKIALVFLITALVAMIFAFFFSSIITRPIASLIKSIQRMAHGDFSVRVPTRGGGELRKLSDAFNSMSEKLEMLDKSRNQFVSNASHELKTPLATMKILLESIIYQPDMEEAVRTDFLTDINKEIDRLSSIIGDLLTLVSMDSKTMHLNKSNFSLAQVVGDNAHRLSTVIEKRNQELILQLNDRCDLYADNSKLTQVVYNLMENASKYTQEGGTIRVRLIRSGHSAILTVTDNGPGIPKEDQAHIFDRFYRVDKARSRETGGTGLGLSIVHQMVLMHGGTVSVESEPGKGSSFIVELPMGGEGK